MKAGAWVHRAMARFACALLSMVLVGHSAASPPRGSVAPAINLKDLNGSMISTASLSPRALVLVFGELGNEPTQRACADVLEVLADPVLEGDPAEPILVVAQDASVAELKEQVSKGRYPETVLHDPTRQAFGMYHVLVIPTVVVVDGKGKVLYSMPAYLQKSKELLKESVLVATGKAPPEQLEELLDPRSVGETHEAIQADRLVQLGHELARHGLYEMAEARYTEATVIVPGHTEAMLGLGELMLRQERLTEAEPLFRSVLSTHPDSQAAILGVASVQVRRGGEDLAKAQAAVEGVIAKDPKQPRARFVMGLIHERRGDAAAAAAEFKKAAELLLDR